MKILVYEHACGGGYAGQLIPHGFLSEGFAMMRCVAADFKSAGHEVTVFLDARISKLNPLVEADCTIPIFYPKEAERFLSVIAKINDSVYIVAPESGKTLQSLVETAQKTGVTVLNCESGAIAAVSDKASLFEALRKNGFSTPKTLVLKGADDLAHIKRAIKRELNYPVIVKSVDGAGCSGLSIVKDDSKLQGALAKVKAESDSERFVVQELIAGQSASVCVISNGKRAVSASLNKQTLTLNGPDEASSYVGGCVPLSHPLKGQAFALAQEVVESFSGLRGYIGVDLVLAENKLYVVDVNPRLTTSYVGLRKVAQFNVAGALANAVLNQKLPEPRTSGVCCFLKIETPKLQIDAFQKTTQLDAVISPPFPIENADKSCALLIGEGKSLNVAWQHLEEAKKWLCSIMS